MDGDSIFAFIFQNEGNALAAKSLACLADVI